LAVLVFPSLPLALAGLVAASLAPTDAALSATVLADRRLPVGVRRVLNVESGLSDGIATPVVTFGIASAATVLGVVGHHDGGGFGAIGQLAVGVGVGPSSCTTCSASTSSPPRPTSPCHPGDTRCAWSSPTTAADWPRAETSPCTTTAAPWARAGSGATQPMVFSADETTDVGYESGTTVSPDYDAHDSRFNGKLGWVQLDVGHDDHDHFIDPEERLRIAMARQ
jgi:hypothetical protein